MAWVPQLSSIQCENFSMEASAPGKKKVMDGFKWRSRTNIVAVIDSALVAIDCIFVTSMIVAATMVDPIILINILFMTPVDHVNDKENQPLLWLSRYVLLLILLGLAVIYCLFEVVALWKLLTAHKLKCGVAKAAKNARFWRNVKFAILPFFAKRILTLLQRNPDGMDFACAVKLIANLAMAIVVQLYALELDIISSAEMTGVLKVDYDNL